MDTGWLLVGVAGITGGLALVLVGAGVATAPLLLPVGLCLAIVAYLAWVAGSSRVVSTVYEEVGDPGRGATADGRTGRPQDRADPDGNWRSTAADGGTDATTGGTAGDRFDGPDGADAGRGAGAGARAGLGPDGERIWDARERDRVGGWDDWDADWEWADRHWRSFQQEYGDADWTETDTGTETGGRERSDASTAGGEGRHRGGKRRTGTRQRGRTDGRRDEERSRDRERRSRRTGPDERRRARREHRGNRRAERARELLDVPADADAETIRSAYRDRVKEVHPDRGGDPELFKRVQWAYEYLSEE